MDTITHGIAGALIGKASFQGDDLFASRPMNRQRIVTWSTTLGAIFPDSDTFRDILSHHELLVITWHRSITHSLLCLPIFAVLLAALTWWFARSRKWDAPSFAILTGIYAVGILSHILLDLITSFGTMIWSPLRWSRPAWDLIFIVDFTFSGILLLPQILSWVHERPEKSKRRALISFVIFIFAIFAIGKLADLVGAPVSAASMLFFILILAALFLLPLGSEREIPASASNTRRARQRIDSSPSPSLDIEVASTKQNQPLHQRLDPTQIRLRWSRAGLILAGVYLALASSTHYVALKRIESFARLQKLEVQSIGALPLPPSLWRWDGLVRTPRGVYEVRMDVAHKSPFLNESSASGSASPAIEYRFYPEAPPNVYIEAAKELPAVKKVLWFDRFPITRFHEEGGESIVEFSDMRFPQIRSGQPASFTYRVRLGPAGNVLEQGWAR